MMTDYVPTSLGRLHVRQGGTGPIAILWHSLFLDSRSWGQVFDELVPHRTVIAIDGPSHGRSEPVARDFTFDECAQAAAEAMDGLGICEPVDWVGNAWGGHVGILLAATRSQRVRTLATIGTPVPGLGVRERLTQGWPLVALYRVMGPIPFLCAGLSEALVGPEAVARQPVQAAAVMEAFRQADRTGMYHAMRSMMLKRPNLSDYLSRISAPTLMMAARQDHEGWPLPKAEAACATMPNARAAVLSGTARVAPLLLDAESIALNLVEFWSEVGENSSQDVQTFGQ